MLNKSVMIGASALAALMFASATVYADSTSNNTENNAVSKSFISEDNDNINQWMPDKVLQHIVSEKLNVPINAITKELLSETNFWQIIDEGSGASYQWAKVRNLSGLENFNSIYMSVRGVNIFKNIDWNAYSFVKEKVTIDFGGDLAKIFPKQVNMNQLNDTFHSVGGFLPSNTYKPVKLNITKKTYEKFTVPVKKFNVVPASNMESAYGRQVSMYVVFDTKDGRGAGLAYDGELVGSNVEFTLRKDQYTPSYTDLKNNITNNGTEQVNKISIPYAFSSGGVECPFYLTIK